MGSDQAPQAHTGLRAGFNSRSRMGSDASASDCSKEIAVSIHAPAWGATRPGTPWTTSATVSIHAPAWGATLAPCAGFFGASSFNSRSRMGSDVTAMSLRASASVSIHAPAWGATKPKGQSEARTGVSIHAPAWGATGEDFFQVNRDKVSIHAPAWGATNVVACKALHARFQFTLPHGERRGRTGRR